MKKEIVPSIILSVVCLLFFCVVYPAIIWGIAQLAPGKGEGVTMMANGKKYYTNIGQKFTQDKYFWSRPSAVDYNASGSGGSNKGPSNPEYLLQVKGRVDTFLAHNTSVGVAEIPSDLVTASGSGLDPHISVQAARVQVGRIAHVRGLPANAVERLIDAHIDGPMYGMGPERINVLLLNNDLDHLK